MGPSILHQKRDTENYLKWIENEPKRTIENRKLTVTNFSKFSQEVYHISPDTLCQELTKMKSSDGEEKYSDLLFNILQEWINWNLSKYVNDYHVLELNGKLKNLPHKVMLGSTLGYNIILGL